MQNWRRIVIHCSDSFWGSEPEIRKWHTDPKPNGNGWANIGYQYIINNGKIRPDYYLDSMNGAIEIGLPIDGDMRPESSEIGAHAYGYNSDSIGICLIGKDHFTPAQFGTLVDLVTDLMVKFEIQIDYVLGHYELNPKKTMS